MANFKANAPAPTRQTSTCFSRLLPLVLASAGTAWTAPALSPASQAFQQEIAHHYRIADGLPANVIQLIDVGPEGIVRVLADGRWSAWHEEQWRPLPDWTAPTANRVMIAGNSGEPVAVNVPWPELIQVVRSREQQRTWLVTRQQVFEMVGVQTQSLGWTGGGRIHQLAAANNGDLFLATTRGLYRHEQKSWQPVEAIDEAGRPWTTADLLGVTVDEQQQLWWATRAGVGCQTDSGWRFYEGKDGLPWNDFTGIASSHGPGIWFGTRLGAIRFQQGKWHYRQGQRWLPHDEVHQTVVDSVGDAWFATADGLGRITQRSMTLADKAAFYEQEIEQFIKRTPFGYVAEAPLATPGDKTSARPHDSDNDGLWTAMYGAGECFAYAATGDPEALRRAREAFDALRFLQVVTQGGTPAPPTGFVARTIRPVAWPDPNVGRLEHDRAQQQHDRLWKVYEPRWPRSADGQWFWKSDTSSDELDGHFFFYPLYFDYCAETAEEKNRVREVVLRLTDHLLDHNYALVDHDGQPTRWAVFGPSALNRDPNWWPERGLNSLSLLSYLSVAAHITGDDRYVAAARELVEDHGYLQNAMYPKVQQGPGSGNQSDDEMAFMCFYSLLKYAPDPAWKEQIRWSFFRYWANEAAELNPFFNFAYAAHNLHVTGANPWGSFALSPRGGWLEESMATLRGFPLDRLNWAHRNRHRLDLIPLRPPAVRDLYEADIGRRGFLVNGRVLPVENRHFNHWNTDPWQLDYSGHGNVLASGTVFLLPYYLGLHHGFIAKPTSARR